MVRRLYLSSLLVLQAALVAHLGPPLSRALHAQTATLAAQDGWPAFVALTGSGATALGLAFALAFPVAALARHRQRGAQRFLGLPRWAVALALAGAPIFIAGSAATGLLPLLPAELRHAALTAGRPAASAGVALLVAGALWAELLRRNVARWHIAIDRRTPKRIEVTDPPELRTRAA